MALTGEGAPRRPTGEARARRLLIGGAVFSVVGVGLSGTMAPTAGGFFLIAGWLALITGVHAFGRAGAG